MVPGRRKVAFFRAQAKRVASDLRIFSRPSETVLQILLDRLQMGRQVDMHRVGYRASEE